MAETTAVAPCAEPCPKCGSSDVNRLFRAKNADWSVERLDDEPPNQFRGVAMTSWRRYAKRDHITHHCRTCQYDWQTLPLRKPKPAPKWKPCAECTNHEGCAGNALVRNDRHYCGATQ